MKWTMITTVLLSPLFSFAQPQTCEAEAVAYAREYMEETYGYVGTPTSVHGSGKVDANGYISYGVEFMVRGENVLVVPQMSADCGLVEIQDF